MMNNSDDPKIPAEDDDSLMNLDDFDEIENLEDFFEDEGASGADVFDAPDEDPQPAQAAPVKAKKPSNALASAGRIVSTVAVLGVIGGGGYLAYSVPAVKSILEDVTGLDLQSGSSGGLRPSGRDPFGTDIAYNEKDADVADGTVVYPGMAPSMTPPAPMPDEQPDLASLPMPMPMAQSENGMDDFVGVDALPVPSPVSNDSGDIVTIDANEMPMPAPVTVKTAPVEKDTQAADADGPVVFDFDTVADASTSATEPAPVAVSKAPEMRTPVAIEPEPQPVKVEQDAPKPAPIVKKEEEQPAPQPVAATVKEAPAASMELPSSFAGSGAVDLSALMGEPQKPAPAKTAKPKATPTTSADSGFYEASPDVMKVLPERNPGYTISVSKEPVYSANAPVSMSPSATVSSAINGDGALKPAVKPMATNAQITTEMDEDPLMVAAGRAMALGRYESALRLYESIERRNPTYTRALKGKAEALQALGRTEQAMETYKTAERIAPNDLGIRSGLLNATSEVAPNMAIDDLLRLYRNEPSNPRLAARIGMSYAGLGDYASAVSYLERAVRLDPKNPIFAFNLAVAADQVGQKEMAIRYYENALQLDNLYGGGATLNRSQIYDRLAVLRG